jgi:hypothetical protein
MKTAMNHRLKFALCALLTIAATVLIVWAFAHFNIQASERSP